MIEGKDVTAKAKEIWDKMDQNERFGVKFGMFPFHPMDDAQREGYDSHKLVVALMNIAGALK